jgi:hypothetical protein
MITDEGMLEKIFSTFHGSNLLLQQCATLFRALLTVFCGGDDGMRKKDTEIPPKRAFV